VNRYVLSPEADQDLTGIWDYIAADSIDAANRWITRLVDASASEPRVPGFRAPESGFGTAKGGGRDSGAALRRTAALQRD
jgi:plasmid stabilization system protein ParE